MNWYNDPKYNFFWQNYSDFMKNDPRTDVFMEHYKKVFVASKKAHLETMNLLSSINWNHDSECHHSPSEAKEDLEFEIDSEVLKFYEESLKFKLEKKKEQHHKSKLDDSRHLSGEQLNLFAQPSSSNAPLERAGQEREEELKLMYGEKAKEIQYLETNLQMIYDKNYDLYQPKFWPSFPLRIKFN
ncbi:gem-associated 8 isoform X1 [Brachionus plicatilis]|uniref:Gem-associated 8 isoform X1 n=1 Tax=Brachionus plicatilis TaxID=10195 RepID=A0A3M7PT17_BRAPC|nr:gem-associated 8 isoform X1 [Brachionus plicatilis]